jgi:glycosyltransferase involved in cell wall biosynthesis
MTRILIFIDWYAPAFKAGGPIRSVYNIVHAFKEDALWYIVTSTKDLGESIDMKGIKKNEWTLHEDINVIYLDSSGQNVESYKKLIQEIKPDALYLNSLFSNHFTLLPIQAYRQLGLKNRLIIAPRGMFSQGALAIKPFKKKLFFIYAKAVGMFKGVIWHASSAIEKKEILQVLGNKVNIQIAPNIGSLPKNTLEVAKPRDELRIIMISRISPIKNIHVLLDAIGKTKNKSTITVTIIGNIEDESYFNECQIKATEMHLNVQFLGALPYHQILPHYATHHVFCSPTSNENFGHAIVEALSHGLPVIISQHTPWRQLQEKGVGYDLPLSAQDFANAIDAVYEMSNENYTVMRKKAHQYAESVLLNPEVLNANKKLFLEK